MKRLSFDARPIGRTTACLVALALSCSVAPLGGCGRPANSEPRFRLNRQAQDPNDFRVTGGEADEAAKQAKQANEAGLQFVADALEAMFGTPDRPFVFRESGLDLNKIRMASGPVGGLSPETQDRDLAALKNRETELKKLQPEKEAEAKKLDADLLTNLTKFATDKGLKDVKAPADLKGDEAAFREQFKSVFEAKAAAETRAAEIAGELADLEMQIRSYLVPQKGLYRQHCAHCHGTTGDGAGPTAAFLFPYPRDYRQGVFKFKSTERTARPTTADLRRILVDGILDTAMPTVALLPPDEVDALVEYVRYLAIRGETELMLRTTLFDAGEQLKPSRSQLVESVLNDVVARWNEAEDKVIKPGEGYTPDADQTAWLKAGEDLFVGDRAKCFSCHGTTGVGDGRKKRDLALGIKGEPLFDDWNKPKDVVFLQLYDLQNSLTQGNAPSDKRQALEDQIARARRVLESWDLPEQEQLPRNLRVGRFRFGRAPIDIYRRIYAGINGTEMPGAGPATAGAKATLSEKEIWQLVDFVLHLPYRDHGPRSTPAGHGPSGAAHGQTAQTGAADRAVGGGQ